MDDRLSREVDSLGMQVTDCLNRLDSARQEIHRFYVECTQQLRRIEDMISQLMADGELVAKWNPEGLDKWNLPALALYRVASGGFVVSREREHPAEGDSPRYEAEHLADDTALVEHFEVDGVVSREE